MNRLLCIVGSMNAGGAETFLMKVYRNIDKSRYQMDFAVSTKSKGYYDDEIVMMGGRIYHIPSKGDGLFNNFTSIRNLVNKEKYKSVLRTSNHSLAALDLLAAKKGGAKRRIFRSSNSNLESKKELILHRLFAFMPRYFANVRFAPSTEAAEFVFGKNCIKKNTATIIHNGVDLSFYKFSQEDRDAMRDEFNIQDKVVIGHIGRFYAQKNHKKLIEIFCAILSECSNCVLVLVGQGELEKDIYTLVKKMGIEEKVIFTGVRKDIPRLLSGMDVFIFPSKYEGMPNTVIEAQATGLPCIISDAITREAKITDDIKYIGLEENARRWAKEALQMAFKQKNRMKSSSVMRTAGYDVVDCANQFVKQAFVDQ